MSGTGLQQRGSSQRHFLGSLNSSKRTKAETQELSLSTGGQFRGGDDFQVKLGDGERREQSFVKPCED